MKRAAKIILAAVMMVLCMSAVSFAQEKTEVTNEDQLLYVLQHGGYAVLQENVTIDEIDSLYIGSEVMVDLNGNNIVIHGGDYTFDANVCFMNGKVNLFGDDAYIHTGTLAMKNGLLNLADLNLRVGNRAYLLEVGEDSHVVLAPKAYSTPVAALSVDTDLISDEMFMKMAITGDLPELKRDGYSFDGWKNRDEKVVTKWQGTKQSDKIHAAWSENTASIFGEGGIWMILTFVFFISTVVLAVMYKRKK